MGQGDAPRRANITKCLGDNGAASCIVVVMEAKAHNAGGSRDATGGMDRNGTQERCKMNAS